MKISLFCAMLLAVAPACAIAWEPATINVPGTMELGSYSGSAFKQVTIRMAEDGGAAYAENFELIVTTKDSTITYPFTASDGAFQVYVATLGGSLYPQIILKTQEGGGTSAASWNLSILTVKDGSLVEQYHKMISEFYGSGERWWYNLSFSRFKKAASDLAVPSIQLDLGYTPPSHDPQAYESPELIPKQKSLRVYFDPAVKKFVEQSD